MKKSYASQGYFFLQSGALSARGAVAAGALRDASRGAAANHRGQLAALAKRVTSPSHFKEVIDAIDKMIAVLADEEAKDLKIKEECEKNRAEDARDAAVTSRKIDELSDAIAQLESEVKDLNEQIEKNLEEIKQNEEELKEATRNRESESAAFKVNQADDRATHELIVSAVVVLKNF